MSTAFSFPAPEYAASRLDVLSGGDLLSFLRQLHWNFLQSIICSSAYLDSTVFVCRVLEALPSDFDDLFDEVTSKTGQNELIRIVCTGYCQVETGKITTDQITGDCARNWSSHVNDESGMISVPQVMDPIFIQESTLPGVHRIASCLDSIGVLPSEYHMFRFAQRNMRNHRVVSRLFGF